MLINYIKFVNDQAVFHEAMAKKFRSDKGRLEKHLATATTFRDLARDLEEASTTPTVSVAADKPIQLDLTFEEVEGLPPELIEELSISDGDRTEFAILKIMKELGGVASLDRLLVGIFRQTGDIMKRATLTSRIYRMSQKGLVFSVPNRKGVYSTREMSEEEAAKL